MKIYKSGEILVIDFENDILLSKNDIKDEKLDCKVLIKNLRLVRDVEKSKHNA